MRRIVFTNDKGGVGKTTTVANLAVGAVKQGRKVLVIDMDPQADVTFALLGERPPEAAKGCIPPTTHALLTGHYTLEQVIMEVPRYQNLFLIPSNRDLADAALKLAHRPTRLRKILDSVSASRFDVVLIDTGKGLDPLVINSLAAASEVVVTVTPGRLELDAIERVGEHVTLVCDEILLGVSGPYIRGILLTLADPYSVTQDTLTRLKMRYPGHLLETYIPKNNDLQKAIGRARCIFEVAPDSKGAQAYRQLLKELGL